MSGAVDIKIAQAWLGEHPNFQKILPLFPKLIALNIDSRAIDKDAIFFAIKGELADGHDYIDSALKNGALLAVAQQDHELLTTNLSHIVRVKDPLKLFSMMCRDYLRSLPARRVALTGSNGKTTTKEMIKSALISIFGESQVYASAGNKNNHFGVPLSALELKPAHKVGVFEMGMNHEGEIASLCEIIEPEIALITNISRAHEGGFSDGIAGIQRAKAEIFDCIRNKGHAVVNLDDTRICYEAQRRHFSGMTTFGFSPEAEIRIIKRESFSLSKASQKISIQVLNQKPIEFEIPLPGIHQAHNAAAALAVVHALGLPVDEAAAGLCRMKTTLGRLSLSHHKAGYLIINDGYNANPASMKAGVQAVLELPAQRRIAVIGHMGELGAKSSEYHFELGKLLATCFDYLLICGKEALPVMAGAQSEGFLVKNIHFENSSQELIEPLKKLVNAGDVVFIKGSLSANMAAVSKALEA